MMRTVRLLLVACVLSLAAGVYQPVEAQFACDKCDVSPGLFHKFDGVGGLYTCYWEGCHSGAEAGHCGDYHWDYLNCDPSEDTEELAAFEALGPALRSDDAVAREVAFAALVELGSEKVVWSPDGEMWQLLNCDGAVLAQVARVSSPE